ncbi:hypothetical protein [Streptomyces lydicus]
MTYPGVLPAAAQPGIAVALADMLQDILGDRGRVLDPRHLEVLELPG